jgi:hypothetical protein
MSGWYMSYRREIRSSQATCEPIQNQTIASNSLILSNIRWSISTPLQDSTALVSHPIQAREYLRSLAPPGRTVAAAEVPAEVLVGIGGAMTGAVGGLHSVEGFEDLLLRDALYVVADGGDLGRLAG